MRPLFSKSGIFGLALAAVLFVFLPMISNGQSVKVFISTACFTLAAMGAGFIYSRLGMVSLAQVGLMGVGGWIALRLNYIFDLPFELYLLIAGLGTSAIGMLLALPALRMRGLYLALMTLMFAAGLDIVFSAYKFPNGGEGFWGVAFVGISEFQRPNMAQGDGAFLRYCIAVTAFGFLLIEAHRRSKAGRAWALIRRSEAAAIASGVNVTFYKTWAFGLTGLLAGLGGTLLAGSLGRLDPGTFGVSESILLFALTVVGGARYWLGALIAAILFRVFPSLLNNLGLDSDLALIVFGAALLHALITAPDGLAGKIISSLSKTEEKVT